MSPSHFRRSLRRALALCSVGVATTAIAAAGQDIPEYEWVVLLDESSSVLAADQRDAPRGYSMRGELMTLMHSMIAARSHALGEPRIDRLTVFRFGKDVITVDIPEVNWEAVTDESDWRLSPPRDFTNWTRLDDALAMAVDHLSRAHAAAEKNLIIISDGELDLEPTNRRPGAPPGPEEVEQYEGTLLNWSSELNRALRRAGVKVTALILDPDFHASSDQIRQQTLYQVIRDADAPNLLAGALELTREIADGRGPTRSEGPFVLSALAHSHGGYSRSVSRANVNTVLWEFLYPDEDIGDGLVVQGATRIVAYSVLGTPVDIVLGRDGRSHTVRLLRNADGTITGNDENLLTSVEARATTHYVTWYIEADEILRAHAGGPIVSFNNLDYVWAASAPPRSVPIGRPVPMELLAQWNPYRDGPTPDEWRARLREGLEDLRAAATVQEPNGDSAIVQLSPTIGEDGSNTVLQLAGQFDRPRVVGAHRARMQLRELSGNSDHVRRSAWASFEAVSGARLVIPELWFAGTRGGRVRLGSRETPPSMEVRSLPAGGEIVAALPPGSDLSSLLYVDSITLRHDGDTDWSRLSPLGGDTTGNLRFAYALDDDGLQQLRVWAGGEYSDYYVMVDLRRNLLTILAVVMLVLLVAWWLWWINPGGIRDMRMRRHGSPTWTMASSARSVYFVAGSRRVRVVSPWVPPFLYPSYWSRALKFKRLDEKRFHFKPIRGSWWLEALNARQWANADPLQPPDVRATPKADDETVEIGLSRISCEGQPLWATTLMHERAVRVSTDGVPSAGLVRLAPVPRSSDSHDATTQVEVGMDHDG